MTAQPAAPAAPTRGRRVLLAEDDRATRVALARALSLDGYEVEDVCDGTAALNALHRQPPDVLVLDMMMPVLGGLDVCRVLRQAGNLTPILMLTARTDVSDRIAGLDAGADDYVPKPYAVGEVLARLRALLRRTTADDGAPARLTLGDLVLDLDGRTVTRGGRGVCLTKTEFAILELLVRNAGLVLDQTVIHDRIWGYDFGPDSKNLAVFILNLRRKLEQHGEPRIVHNVRGVGYVARLNLS